ncbi:MAG: 4Fe-4S dicluster domain-containing protein [Clostridia bacterium]|nr:4Fe-4S dicluster domain-containing protein [Clostridia bacterium]
MATAITSSPATPEKITPGVGSGSLLSLASWVEAQTGQPFWRCYQCRKCSGGCPVAFSMDILPHQIIRYLQLGLGSELLSSQSIWNCTGCQTCKSRCPNGIDISALNDALKVRALAQKPALDGQSQAVATFHQTFLDSIRGSGRVNELFMLLTYKLKTRNLWQDVSLGLAMLRRGKLRIWPQRIRGRGEIKELFKRSRLKPPGGPAALP